MAPASGPTDGRRRGAGRPWSARGPGLEPAQSGQGGGGLGGGHRLQRLIGDLVEAASAAATAGPPGGGRVVEFRCHTGNSGTRHRQSGLGMWAFRVLWRSIFGNFSKPRTRRFRDGRWRPPQPPPSRRPAAQRTAPYLPRFAISGGGFETAHARQPRPATACRTSPVAAPFDPTATRSRVAEVSRRRRARLLNHRQGPSRTHRSPAPHPPRRAPTTANPPKTTCAHHPPPVTLARRDRIDARPMSPGGNVGPNTQTYNHTKEDEMTEQLQAPRRVPRALTPFRHTGYRRLALALVLSSFASGVWIVALVWEVIRIGGGPGQLSVVTTANAVGVLLPALLGGVVADRIPQKLILLGVAGIELTGMIAGRRALADRHHPAVAPRRGLVRDRRRHGVLLPGLLRVAARARARVRPAGGQRLRGHGAASDRPGHRARRRRVRGRRAVRRVPPSPSPRARRCWPCSRWRRCR